MSNSRNLEKEDYWRQIVASFAKSSLPVRQFCVDHQIAENSFYHWRRELLRRDTEAAEKNQARTPLPQQSPSADQPIAVPLSASETQETISPFVPVHLTDQNDWFDLLHPSGCRLRIAEGFNANLLQEVLKVLDQQPTCEPTNM